MLSGKFEIYCELFDLHVVLHPITEMFTVRAIEKGILYETRVDESVPKYLYTDPGRLRQVLVNLIDNSMKFTQSGRVRLSIELVKATAPPLSRRPKQRQQQSSKRAIIHTPTLSTKSISNSSKQSSTATSIGESDLLSEREGQQTSSIQLTKLPDSIVHAIDVIPENDDATTVDIKFTVEDTGKVYNAEFMFEMMSNSF